MATKADQAPCKRQQQQHKSEPAWSTQQARGPHAQQAVKIHSVPWQGSVLVSHGAWPGCCNSMLRLRLGGRLPLGRLR